MSLLRRPLLALARSEEVKRGLMTLPLTAAVVRGYVAGESTAEAVRVTADLVGEGLAVTIDHLGELTTDTGRAEDTTQVYLALLDDLAAHGLARRAEVSLKLSAVGLSLGDDGVDLALANAHRICEAARAVATTVTVDVNGYVYASTIGVMGGRFLIPFSADKRAATGLSGGDPISVDLILDTAPRTVEVPDDLAAALDAAGARAAFDALAPSARKAHVANVEGAKTADTRARRITSLATKLG